MKASKFSALLALAILFVTTAFAATNKATVEIKNDVMISGKTLPAGKYIATWEGEEGNADLSLAHGKQVIIKTPAYMRSLPNALTNNAVVVKENPDGTHSLSQIQVSGKKYALEIGGSTSQTDVASRVK